MFSVSADLTTNSTSHVRSRSSVPSLSASSVRMLGPSTQCLTKFTWATLVRNPRCSDDHLTSWEGECVLGLFLSILGGFPHTYNHITTKHLGKRLPLMQTVCLMGFHCVTVCTDTLAPVVVDPEPFGCTTPVAWGDFQSSLQGRKSS